MQIDDILIQSCPYTLKNGRNAAVERYQYQTYITLRETKTGAVIDETILPGTMPAECSSETRFEEDELIKEVYGVAAGVGQVSSWLETYIELP
jgi:hypothetical protein